MKVSPPKWADRFLRWYCNPRFLEEIEGDIYELFERREDVQGPKIAKIKFVWDVFRFFRWSNIKRSNSKYNSMHQLELFGNYLKLGMRNIRRNLVSSSINIFGLAIAICFAISVLVFTDVIRNMDYFHTKKERVYQILNYVEQDGGDALWSDSPIALGPQIAAEHPSVEAFTRVEYVGASVKYENDVFDELAVFVDPDFFKMFDFDFLGGNGDVLSNKNQIVLSRAMAVKYFDDGEDPLGKLLSFKFYDGQIKKFTVGAVLDEYPYNSGIAFDFYVPIANGFDLEIARGNDWAYMTDATFILLEDKDQIGAIAEDFERYQELQNESDPEWVVSSYDPIQLKDISTNSYRIQSSVIGGAHPAGTIALSVIALFLLAMACFNYMNIAVVGASKRLKEIALRKVMGSVRREIIKQFLVENLLQCFFALIVGSLLAYFTLIPWFNVMVPEVGIQFRTANPISMVLFFIFLFLGVGLVSGAYPAFYISRFNAITIFKGKEKFGARNLFSKIMLGVQFFLSVITVVGCIVFLDQSFYMGEKDWGYDPKGTMSIYVADEDQFELLKNEVVKQPAVGRLSASNYLIGRSIGVSSLDIEDRQLAIRRIGVREDFAEILGLRLVQGRFLTDQSIDQSNNVVVNERMVAHMNWEESEVLGKSFMMDSVRRTVVGVVEDFHYYQFYLPIEPVIIHGIEKSAINYLTVEVEEGQLAQLDNTIRESWLDIAPNDPYDRTFQEDVFDDFYQDNRSNISLISMITGIAILLACLGLYGLLSFNVQGNLKEYGVRKVLGADPKNIIKIVGKQYLWVLSISFVIGAPLGALGMMALVKEIFPDAKSVSAAPFLVSVAIMLVTLIMTVAGQINKAIRVNPAELLRSE